MSRGDDLGGASGAASSGEGQGPASGGGFRLYSGRYETGPAPSLDELNRSLPLDRRLWQEDIEASRAWAQALVGAGVLSSDEGATLDAGLVRVAVRIGDGEADAARDEDIHTLVERLLYAEVGELAGKLHTGRSRNDQVATDARLWLMRALGRNLADLVALQRVLLAQASRTVDLLMPGYTHMRRAQPVRVAHWLLSHFWAFDRDRSRVGDALARVAVLPLGSGAIAGSGFAVDRPRLAEVLGFRDITTNSMDTVGDRDWVCEAVFVLALQAAHLSRLAADLILFSSEEFGFLRLPEAYTTGSSLMPQKRNPDGLELARGKAARLAGDVAALLAMLKGLPTGYQKDLQEDKEVLFHAVDTLAALLPVTRETVAALDLDAMALDHAATDAAMLATDLADELVRRGVPFREAHGIVGRLVGRAEELAVSLADLPAAELAAAHPALAEDAPTLTARASVEARNVPGGTARSAVVAQLELARARLEAHAG